MINAMKAKEITREFHDRQEAERLARIDNFLDTECEKAIIEKASSGHRQAEVNIPAELKGSTFAIKMKLEEEGYSVKIVRDGNPSLIIWWSI